MEILFEFIIDLIFEGAVEASKSRRVPRPIRYFLIALIVLAYLALIGLFVVCGISCWRSGSILGATVIFLLGAVVALICVLAFRKTYLKKKNVDED